MDEQMNKELNDLEERVLQINERAKMIKIMHEDVVIINRHDTDTSTWLELSERNREGRRRTSWYGTILTISDINCGDDVRENKKKQLAVGDIVIFNPESAYSLNIAGYPEIWILHVDSILTKDSGYNYLEQKKENIKKKHDILSEQNRRVGVVRP